jgi:hypothetical protein
MIDGLGMGYLWAFMGFHGLSMGFHGLSWAFYGLLWAFMGFAGLSPLKPIISNQLATILIYCFLLFTFLLNSVFITKSTHLLVLVCIPFLLSYPFPY